MPGSLQDRTAIVTGASAGIGRAISLALAGEGARCVLAGRRREKLEETIEEIFRMGGEALTVLTDVTDETQLASLVRMSVEHFGGLQILVNNAGIYHHGSLETLEKKRLEEVLATNLVAPIMLTKLALPHLKKNPESAVINIASIAGLSGFSKGSAYCASKFGVVGFSECLFEEVREQGIKVCAICPGYVSTPMTEGYSYLDLEKMIPPEDVAQAVIDVLQISNKSCPTQVIMRPQYSPVKTPTR
jgi:NAD(P)-dependent dehydrogenase (short-subunit alcohol dehydrogenase family)